MSHKRKRKKNGLKWIRKRMRRAKGTFAKGAAYVKDKAKKALRKKRFTKAEKAAQRAYLRSPEFRKTAVDAINRSGPAGSVRAMGTALVKPGASFLARLGIAAGRGPARNLPIKRRFGAAVSGTKPSKALVLKAAGIGAAGSTIAITTATGNVLSDTVLGGIRRARARRDDDFSETGGIQEVEGVRREPMPGRGVIRRYTGRAQAVPQGRAAVKTVEGQLVPRVSRQQVLLDYGRYLSGPEFFQAYGYMPQSRRRRRTTHHYPRRRGYGRRY